VGTAVLTPVTAGPSFSNVSIPLGTADFNGDGIPDLAFSDEADYALTILLGKGDGTFTAAASPPTNYAAASLAVGDFNGDGILDLAYGTSIRLGRGKHCKRATTPILLQWGTNALIQFKRGTWCALYDAIERSSCSTFPPS
jgi:hypothetical protein